MTTRIEPLHVPSALDDADAAGFRDFVALGNAVWRRDSGTDLHDDEPAELLSRWQDRTYSTHVGVLALDGEHVVGAGTVELDNSGTHTAQVDVIVADDRDDVGDRLLAEVERIASDHGRDTLHAWTIHRADAGGDRLEPPTGAGSIPAHDAAAQRMLRAGFVLSQVERNSVFDLHGSFEATNRLLAEATAAAGPDYRTVWWTGRTPDEYAAGYAAAIARMDTDVPAGDMLVEQSRWDAERIRSRDDRLARSGSLLGVTLVIHEPIGQVAAFNELHIGADRTRPTAQWGTLVMPEHRGRRLGSIVKCLGLRNWRDAVPESPCVSTFNAEENRYMLDVNEAVGFVPAAYSGAWEKRVS